MKVLLDLTSDEKYKDKNDEYIELNYIVENRNNQKVSIKLRMRKDAYRNNKMMGIDFNHFKKGRVTYRLSKKRFINDMARCGVVRIEEEKI